MQYPQVEALFRALGAKLTGGALHYRNLLTRPEGRAPPAKARQDLYSTFRYRSGGAGRVLLEFDLGGA